MKQITRWLFTGIALLLLSGIGFTLTSCSTPRAAAPAAAAKPASAGGAQLWAQNCGHCHNIRSPDSYSDAQWDVALLHMRVRANLTADEHEKILAFLKSAH